MPRVNNNQAGELVRFMETFTTNNQTMFAEYKNGNYVVYSYGHHFPMFANIGGRWIGNGDKYSVTTSRHQNICRPSNVSEYVDTSTLKAMINGKTKEQSEQDVLKFASTVAKLGSLFHTEKEDQNNWKKRMLNTVDGVSFPDNWDSLSEDEKEKRLNKAIEIND